MSQIHARIFIFAKRSVLTVCVKFKIPNERRAHARASDRWNTERETINRLFSAKIYIVLKYRLLNVKLRFKSQHAVRKFYESMNFKVITACNCLNINIIG